jgi:hypothetical protein
MAAMHKPSIFFDYFGVYSLNISLLRTPSTPTQKPEKPRSIRLNAYTPGAGA